ncbi:tail tape measure protein [uncultured Sphingomonas sp.]|uniref:tail tape measure protein n=1 Tax=uncultured Sphingomonas sp. TaxID=158754 RepID=UPI0035CA05C8
MDEEIERLVIGVRADTAGFARDVASMKSSLGDGLGSGADVAGRAIETSLLRAVKSGKLGFDDLRKVALSAMDQIAAAALKGGIQSILGGGTASGGAGSLLTAAAGLLTGLPGRATGGPVSPGRAYMVGERGPELFVPTSSGSVAAAPSGSGSGSARDVRVAISVQAGAGEAPAALQRSSRQVARAVKAALAGV